jgi:uncharacterized Zn finger protein (UPF0148 family)
MPEQCPICGTKLEKSAQKDGDMGIVVSYRCPKCKQVMFRERKLKWT